MSTDSRYEVLQRAGKLAQIDNNESSRRGIRRELFHAMFLGEFDDDMHPPSSISKEEDAYICHLLAADLDRDGVLSRGQRRRRRRQEMNAIQSSLNPISPSFFSNASLSAARPHRPEDIPNFSARRFPGLDVEFLDSDHFARNPTSVKNKEFDSEEHHKNKLSSEDSEGEQTFKIKCPICFENCHDPASTFCGHVFCNSCIKMSLMKNQKCPICNIKLAMNLIHRIYI